MREVVPYVGTWIEITKNWQIARMRQVVPYVGTWIEMQKTSEAGYSVPGRSLRGNVDRNVDKPSAEQYLTVVPYVGTWIEI